MPSDTARTGTKLAMPGRLDSSRVVKTLRPGQPGTRKAVREHGNALVCVRYPRDALKVFRFTTIELVVNATPVNPRLFDLARFGVHVAPHEQRLHDTLRAAGARWDGRARLWWTRGAIIRQMNLIDRIRAI